MTATIYERVTADLIATIEEKGALPWRRDWTKGAGGALEMPIRANGEAYRGINVLILWATAMSRGYAANQWLTFKQAKDLGANVRKGEKGAPVVYYGTVEREADNGESKAIAFAKSYTVFNVEQIDGLPSQLQPDLFDGLADLDTGARHDAAVQAFYAATGARIITRGDRPCYIPSLDQVHMPRIETFDSAAAYYGTLAHELVHWTGHKSRLDRLNIAQKEGYAFEELVAEIGACFVTAARGGVYDVDNSAAYLAGWLKALRGDCRFIFKAAAKAQAAADFIAAKAEQAGEALAA